ncbi:unnamed protein product [Rhizoctonia solani]|uniref:Uncharacterized protein n=1 Tax=Rhizoctonia solani TaxID=456999 RepID=A0A8H3HLJ4_9AGAM|nr:unnamed protein product [Rhizoctonia solani]
MVIAPLQPIVAPVVSGPFECFGDGLLYGGIKCEHPKILKDLLIPTKSSKSAAIRDKDHPRMWWRAQCLHYGLPSPPYSTISTYRTCLERALRRSDGLKRPQQLIDLEMEQNDAFKRLNPEVRDGPSANLQQLQSTKTCESRVRVQANLSSGLQATASRKRKADTAIRSCHPNSVQLPDSDFIIPVSMKKARVNAPAPSTRSRNHPRVVFRNPQGNRSTLKGIPGGPSGKYELDSSFGPSSRSDEKSKLYVTMLKSGWFQAALFLPGFFECLIRPRANVNIAINGYLRFEWCGWNEQTGEVVPPSVGNIGWLKIYNAEGRVKGAIQTPLGQYLIQGRRVKSGSHSIQDKWEDYSGHTYSHIGS